MVSRVNYCWHTDNQLAVSMEKFEITGIYLGTLIL